MIVPRHVLGGAGYIAPSERQVGGIAPAAWEAATSPWLPRCRRENIVALCDGRSAPPADSLPNARRSTFRAMIDKEERRPVIGTLITFTPRVDGRGREHTSIAAERPGPHTSGMPPRKQGHSRRAVSPTNGSAGMIGPSVSRLVGLARPVMETGHRAGPLLDWNLCRMPIRQRP